MCTGFHLIDNGCRSSSSPSRPHRQSVVAPFPNASAPPPRSTRPPRISSADSHRLKTRPYESPSAPRYRFVPHVFGKDFIDSAYPRGSACNVTHCQLYWSYYRPANNLPLTVECSKNSVFEAAEPWHGQHVASALPTSDVSQPIPNIALRYLTHDVVQLSRSQNLPTI